MGKTNKLIDGWDIPGSAKDAGNALLSHFGFKSIGRKGKKGPNFPVNNSGRPCKTVHPGRPRKMADNQLSSEAVVVFLYQDDGKEGNTEIVEAVPYEDDEGDKKVISEMDEEALLLKESDKKVSTEKNMEEIVEAVLYEYV